MLGYFFQAGAAGQSDLSAKWGLGARFVKEGAAVLLAVKLNPGLAEWISDGMEVAGGEVGEDDVHLVVEYKRQEVWDGVASPRANRFIVHHNLNNPLVSRLEKFSASLPGFGPQLLVVGGLQMIDNFPFMEGRRVERLMGIRNHLESVDQNTLLHFEMARFMDGSLLSELTEHIIPHVDSVGMNEQELPNLESILIKGGVVEVANSNPRLAVMLHMMRTVFRKLSFKRSST